MIPPPPRSSLFPYTTLFRSSFSRCPPTPPRDPSRSPLASGSRSEEHTSELQSRVDLVCRLLLEKKKMNKKQNEQDPLTAATNHSNDTRRRHLLTRIEQTTTL